MVILVFLLLVSILLYLGSPMEPSKAYMSYSFTVCLLAVVYYYRSYKTAKNDVLKKIKILGLVSVFVFAFFVVFFQRDIDYILGICDPDEQRFYDLVWAGAPHVICKSLCLSSVALISFLIGAYSIRTRYSLTTLYAANYKFKQPKYVCYIGYFLILIYLGLSGFNANPDEDDNRGILVLTQAVIIAAISIYCYKYKNEVNEFSPTYHSYEIINGTKFYSDYSKLYVGDYVYEDGTFTHKLSSEKNVCGVVISLKTTSEEYKKGWTHGTIMAMSDVNGGERFQWSKNIEGDEYFAAHSIDEIQYAINNRDGYIFACQYIKEGDKFPAFGVLDKQPCVTNSTGWYIPTLGQWAEILNFVGGAGIHTYNNRLSYSLDHTESGFVKYGFSTSYYWTSNLRDTRTVWALYLGKDDSQNDYLNKTEYAKIRAVAAF